MDITKHEFSDEDINHAVEVEGHFDGKGFVEINFCNGNCLHIHEEDAIALAKFFKLTSADIE